MPTKYLRLCKVLREPACWLGVIAAVVYLLELRVSASPSNYDTGVYVGAAIHMAHGALPYQKFVFVQPPGILYFLMVATPFGILGGTPSVLLVARVLLCCINGGNVALVGLLARRRGRLLSAVASLVFALLPVTVFVSDSVKLEPLLTFICLSAFLVLGSSKSAVLLTRKQLVLAGILFGVAMTVKYWAVIPIGASLPLLVPKVGRRIFLYLGAIATTFVVLVTPFLLCSPTQFIQQTMEAQVRRGASSGWEVTFWTRVEYLFGANAPSLEPSVRSLAIVSFEVLLALGIGLLLRREKTFLENLILSAALASVGFVLVVPEFFPYYATFALPYCVVVTVSSLGGFFDACSRLRQRFSPSARLLSLSKASAMILLVLFAGTLYVNWDGAYRSTPSSFNVPLPDAVGSIPHSSCVTFDVTYYSIEGNLVSTSPRCPVVVDPSGMQLAAGNGSRGAAVLARQWMTILKRSDYLVLESPSTPFLPWNSELTFYLAQNFHALNPAGSLIVYERVAVESPS